MNAPLKRNQDSFDAFTNVGCAIPFRLTSLDSNGNIPTRKYAMVGHVVAPSIVDSDKSSLGSLRNTIYESKRSLRKKRLLHQIHKFFTEGELNSAGERIKISDETARSASALFATLPNDFSLPKIAPEGDGGLTAIWGDGERKLILVVEDWKLHFVNYATTPNAEYFDDYRFDGERIPNELIGAIPKQ